MCKTVHKQKKPVIACELYAAREMIMSCSYSFCEIFFPISRIYRRRTSKFFTSNGNCGYGSEVLIVLVVGYFQKEEEETVGYPDPKARTWVRFISSGHPCNGHQYPTASGYPPTPLPPLHHFGLAKTELGLKAATPRLALMRFTIQTFRAELGRLQWGRIMPKPATLF